MLSWTPQGLADVVGDDAPGAVVTSCVLIQGLEFCTARVRLTDSAGLVREFSGVGLRLDSAVKNLRFEVEKGLS